MRFALLLLLLLAGCFEDANSPEGALQDFMEKRMERVVTREFVVSRTTGKMRESLEHMSDEDFQKYSDLRAFKQNSFKVLSKSCQDKKCFITYAISYRTVGENNKTTFTTEVKKIAEVQRVEGKWLIADVSNIKTYHEAMEPIDALAPN